jgi:putative nucleotidyltransferase with HDIG domain
MEKRYLQIWELAKPYYKKGRPMDIAHINWMTKNAEKVVEKENLDSSILIPLVILHDVGYAVSKKAYFEKDKKTQHMKEGAKISREILEKLNYDKKKIKVICGLIKIHDNWIFGDYKIYKKNKILWVFNDLDFIWLLTKKGFSEVRKVLNLNKKQMLEYIKKDKRHQKLGFATKTTEKLYKDLLKKII